MGDRHKIPPAPHPRRYDAEILTERPDTLGLVLWQFIRHLEDWIQTPPSRRDELFPQQQPGWVHAKRQEALLLAPELSPSLTTLANLPRRQATVARVLAGACEAVAAWAEERRHTHLALAFAECACALEPASPRRANAAGRLQRDAGDFPRAESWFERGIALARENGNRVEYTRGHLGAGILYMTLDRAGRARRHLSRASNVAMKEGHEWLAAEAQHDLFHFMTVRGQFPDAELHARRALRWYPKHHPRFPLFVADVAFLFVCERLFSAAAELLNQVLRTVDQAGPRTVISALWLRAMAASKQTRSFEQSHRRVLKLLSRPSEWEAAARWNLAEAERAAGMWDAAEENANKAIELARARRDAETERFARTVLQEIRERVAVPPELRRTDESFVTLLAELQIRLAEWSPTRRGRVPTLDRRDWAA